MIKKKVAVLISGNGSNLQALIDACANPDFPAEIALVISNKEDAFGVKRAEKSNIPVKIICNTDYVNRDTFDTALHDVLVSAKIEYVCLAGFMRLLTPSFVNKWKGRMLNIHPALLPLFKGMHTHEKALEAGVKIHGATVHHVVAEMDSGPIVIQGAVPVLEGDTPETLKNRVHKVEHMIYPLALKKLIYQQKVLPEDTKFEATYIIAE